LAHDVRSAGCGPEIRSEHPENATHEFWGWLSASRIP